MFSEEATNLLHKMRIDPDSYFKSLKDEFKNGMSVFDSLLTEFSFNTFKLEINHFKTFCEKNAVADDATFYDCLYDMFNYLKYFFDAGVYGLFKSRPAEWNGPRIILIKEDVKHLKSDEWDETKIIYRGLSKKEHNNKKYGQSWTTDINVAKRFAFNTYSNMEDEAVVVQSKISKEDIVFHDSNDNECEVIVEEGSISDAEIIDLSQE